jgi:SAM-dependent methyltransferase
LNTSRADFIRSQSTAALDTFFHVRPVTDVPRVGPEALYLQGLTQEALFTCYHDVLEAMEWLHGQGARSWCDLGCGIGRTALLWAWLFSDGEGQGVEMVPERLEEARGSARAMPLPNTRWVEGDFAAPGLALPAADVYFLYLSTGPALDALLDKLKKRARPAWVVVVESHGDLKPRLQWESWWLTSHPQRFALQSRRHDPWVGLYQVRTMHPALRLEQEWEGRMGLLPEDLARHPSPLGYLLGKSFRRHWELVIAEGEKLWTMETLGLAWHDAESVQGESPRRQVSWREGGVGLRRVPSEAAYQELAHWRRSGLPLEYRRSDGQSGLRVQLRKIYIAPEIAYEFSDGRVVAGRDLEYLRPAL